MDFSRLLTSCHVYSAAQSTSELLPVSQAAIYAFYEALDFSRGTLSDEIDKYVTSHGRYVTMDKDGWPFHLKLRFRGNPERFKGEGLRLAKAQDSASILMLREQLLFLSFLNEPLYVGKTEDVRKRFL